MTDGLIDMNVSNTSLQNKLDSYKNNVMSNGTPLNIVYLGMSNAANATADTIGNLYTYGADSDTEIISVMQEIAKLVSGRMDSDQINQVNDTTVTVTSKLPLYSLSILSQKSNAKVVSAKTSEEDLNVQRNLSLDATNLANYGVPIESLYGNAAVINKQNAKGESQVIPAGTYTIEFSSKIDINNMMIQIEPAIDIKFKIKRKGITIDDLSKIQNKDTIDIEIFPVIPGTDTVILDSDMPKNVAWTVEYEVDGKVVDSNSSTSLIGVTLKKGSNVIRGIMNIPGYVPFARELYFNIEEVINNFGINVIQPKDLSYKRSDIDNLQLDNTNTVRFEVTNNGKALTKDEQAAIGVLLQIDNVDVTPYSGKDSFYGVTGNVNAKCKLQQNDDGSYSLIPSRPIGIQLLFIKVGTYTVHVSLSIDNTITNKGEFTFIPSKEDLKNLFKIIAFIVGFIYLVYLIFKKKFKGQTVHYECWRIQEDGTGVLQKGMSDSQSLGVFSGHFFIPPRRASHLKYRGLELVAESHGGVIITGESIARTVAKYGTSNRNPKNYLNNIESHLHKTEKSNGQREASDQELTNRPIYFKSNEGTRDIWRIWLTED
ncbi:hypothetical protein P261_00121 [Lachnospiraceae bacterium TWA4]|nr:hypothetical protein P261_00121 [Lachnospiraceae bacterium TWA4]